MVTQLLRQPGNTVVATCRDPAGAGGLQALAARAPPGVLSILALDNGCEDSIARAAAQVAERHAHLDLLVNASGVLHIPGQLAPETSYSRVTAHSLETNFRTNAFGPFLVAKAFMPLLVRAAEANGASDTRPAVLASLSARVGSIGDNRLGGWYAYRASKAALNALMKTLALEAGRKRHKVATLLLHPGTCDTDLSAPFQKNVAPEKLFPRERGAEQLLALCDAATMADNGRFLAWDGSEIPW